MIGGMWIPTEPEPCGAQEWAWFDDTPDGREQIILYGTCRLPKGHTSRWHADWDDSDQVLAEWSGPRDSRAPAGIPVWEPEMNQEKTS